MASILTPAFRYSVVARIRDVVADNLAGVLQCLHSCRRRGGDLREEYRTGSSLSVVVVGMNRLTFDLDFLKVHKA